MQNLKKKCMPAAKLLLVKNWGKNGAHLPQPTTRTSLGNFHSYIPLLPVMTTLNYHGLYQISSLEANLSLEATFTKVDPLTPPKLIIKSDLF